MSLDADPLLAWVLGPGHLDALDERARPLGEQASRRYREAPRREAVRRFGDARDATGRPCNVAALEALRGEWPWLLETLRSLHGDAPNTMERVHRRVFAAVVGAPLSSHRTGRVSVRAAALFKVALGYADLVPTLLFERRLDADDPPPGVDALDRWLDERPWLIGASQVCAGTRAQIHEVWRALTDDAAAVVRDDAADTALELAALTAAAAGAARRLLREGRAPSASASVSARLYGADATVRLVASLRQVPDAGPMHATLLYGADRVPRSLCALLSALPAPDDPRALERLDAALAQTAAPVLERLRAAPGLV
ncbi:MAG TPA: hypothetical protein RMH99_01440 [Sandaracinaceae bacterium LLY-WYZ-13_1]|nr:hypothetical protein [Sandaracinaceae bacterium LLY-WYZ-13_1]